MKVRPILFSSEMVQAILAGEKTQTRRVVNPQPASRGALITTPADQIWYTFPCDDGVERFARCPYGKIGDWLWVRETWAVHKELDRIVPRDCIGSKVWFYATDHRDEWCGRWRPSIHLPYDFHRIDLEVIDVRCERLQSISESDAEAEGIEPRIPNHVVGAVYRYAQLWNSINAKRGYSWDSNPFVWVVSFRVVAPQPRLAPDPASCESQA